MAQKLRNTSTAAQHRRSKLRVDDAMDTAMDNALKSDSEEDVDNISAFVGQVEGVKTGVTIRQLTPTRCKISLRTDPGDLNASDICALLGGGGHAAAAGATVDGTPEEAGAAILAAIREIQSRR